MLQEYKLDRQKMFSLRSEQYSLGAMCNAQKVVK